VCRTQLGRRPGEGERDEKREIIFSSAVAFSSASAPHIFPYFEPAGTRQVCQESESPACSRPGVMGGPGDPPEEMCESTHSQYSDPRSCPLPPGINISRRRLVLFPRPLTRPDGHPLPPKRGGGTAVCLAGERHVAIRPYHSGSALPLVSGANGSANIPMTKMALMVIPA
jgi:hypothetical protein